MDGDSDRCGGAGGAGGKAFAHAGEHGYCDTTPGVDGAQGVGPNDEGVGGTGGVAIANSKKGENAYAKATGGDGGEGRNRIGDGGGGGVARSYAIGGGGATSHSSGGGKGKGVQGQPGEAGLSEAWAEGGGDAKATVDGGIAIATSIGGGDATSYSSGGGTGKGAHGQSGETGFSEACAEGGDHGRATVIGEIASATSNLKELGHVSEPEILACKECCNIISHRGLACQRHTSHSEGVGTCVGARDPQAQAPIPQEVGLSEAYTVGKGNAKATSLGGNAHASSVGGDATATVLGNDCSGYASAHAKGKGTTATASGPNGGSASWFPSDKGNRPNCQQQCRTS